MQLPEDWRELLESARNGDTAAETKLYNAMQSQLGLLARGLLQSPRARGKNSLETLMLVGDAYVALLGDYSLEDQRHLRSFLLKVMRHRVIDYVYSTKRKGRGKARQNSEAVERAVGKSSPLEITLLEFDEVRQRLGAEDSRQVQVFDLYYFERNTVNETAALLSVGPATIKRDLRYIRAEFMDYFDESEE